MDLCVFDKRIFGSSARGFVWLCVTRAFFCCLLCRLREACRETFRGTIFRQSALFSPVGVCVAGGAAGPKDLMPQVAWGTMTQDFVQAIRLYRQTTIAYQADRFNIIHVPIGIASMSKDQLRENFEAAIASINACRPPGTGNKFLQKVHISSTMGPGILIDMRHVKETVAARARSAR